MNAIALDFGVSMVAMSVMMVLLMVTSGSPRRLRIGITAAASVVMASASAAGLELMGQPVGSREILELLGSLKVMALSWAALDVARIAIRIGTLDAVEAANAARGFLMSRQALQVVWSAWANAIPVPCWAKGVNGEMLAINRSYQINYGKTPDDYVGETDKAVWPEGSAESFAEHDRIVAETGRSLLCVEPAPTWSDRKRVATFLKFPVIDSHGNIAAIGGIEVSDTRGLE